MITIVNPSMMMDLLYALHPDSGTDPLLAKTLLVGAVSTVMAASYDASLTHVFLGLAPFMPREVMATAIPEGFAKPMQENGINIV